MTNTSCFLSILIPTRNRANYLYYAISSVLGIQSDDIEIIISNNHSIDNTEQVLNSFSDKRMRVMMPSACIPMHENFELLLHAASGKWLYFLGDDDALMPHCLDYLKYLDNTYPNAEAIVSPRAYYNWQSASYLNSMPYSCAYFDSTITWKDSKRQLKNCLNGTESFLNTPQLYSGGFQKQTLVKRILRAQNGLYFKSVTPDSYAGVAALIYTCRYLHVGIPMAWVGSSPKSNYGGSIECDKDKVRDFFDPLSSSSIQFHELLGNSQLIWPHYLFFIESYLQATSFCCHEHLNYKFIKKAFIIASVSLFKKKNYSAVRRLRLDLGVSVTAVFELIPAILLDFTIIRFKNISNKLSVVIKLAIDYLLFCFSFEKGCYFMRESFSINSTRINTILSLDPKVKRIYGLFSSRFNYSLK